MTAYHTNLTTNDLTVEDTRQVLIGMIYAGVLADTGDNHEAEHAEYRAESMELNELIRWAGAFA